MLSQPPMIPNVQDELGQLCDRNSYLLQYLSSMPVAADDDDDEGDADDAGMDED